MESQATKRIKTNPSLIRVSMRPTPQASPLNQTICFNNKSSNVWAFIRVLMARTRPIEAPKDPTIIPPRARVLKIPEDYLGSPLLNSYLHHQEIKVSYPLCFDESPNHTFPIITHANPSSTSQEFWIYGDPLMEWIMLIHELLMYATDPQVKWLDGNTKKWRENFGVQHVSTEQTNGNKIVNSYER